MQREVVDWLVLKTFGKRLTVMVKENAIGDLELLRRVNRSSDKVCRRNKTIKSLENDLRIVNLHLETKERTISAKNNEIKSRKYQSRLVIDELKDCLGEKDDIIYNCSQALDVALYKTLGYRRQIKRLHDNVRARDVKIQKLQSRDELVRLTEENRILFNNISECKSRGHKLERKIEYLKDCLAKKMAK